MIQRYGIAEDVADYWAVERDDGEWVKWDDVLDLLDDYDIDINKSSPDFAEQRAILSVWSKGCHTELDFDTGIISVVSKDGLMKTPVYNQWTKEVLVEDNSLLRGIDSANLMVSGMMMMASW